MLTSIRGLTAATLSACAILSASPALASQIEAEANPESPENGQSAAPATVFAPTAEQIAAVARASAPIDPAGASAVAGEDSSGVTFSANIALASEYRFRGVALTDGKLAVQGGFDLAHGSGLYVGTWASNLDETTVGYGSAELDIYGGWSGSLVEGLSADAGAIMYIYPDAGPGDSDYVEFYGSLTFGLGPAELTGGVAYAPEQDSLGGTDNTYVYADASLGLPGSPLTLKGHLGYTDGFLTFTNDSTAVDWSVGAEVSFGPATLGAAYVGVEGDPLIDPGGTFTDDAFVVTLSASF